MTLGIININSCLTSKLLIIEEKLFCVNGISCRQFLLYILNTYQCNLFTISLIIYLLLLVITIQ